MAEAVVTALIDKIISAFGDEVVKPLCCLLLREASPSEVHRRMNIIKGEFELMRSYLRQVDQRKDGDQLMEAWARSLRDLVYQVEDITDEYTYRVGYQQRSSFLYRTFLYCKNIKSWHSINSQLQEVDTRITNLKSQKELCGIKEEGTSSATERYRPHRESSYLVDEEEIVGFDEYRDLLIGWLTEDEPQRTIFSVWGMGGLGKTTLVMDVYKNRIVRQYFHCKAWVFVSQMYTTDDLLRKIMKELLEENEDSLPYDIDAMPLRRLVDVIQSYLRHKRYLIVLDDVWSANAWFEVSTALLDSRCSSRIILTTRIHNVALLALESHVIELHPLSESDSWVLFCKKAFWKDGDRICPRELEYWARKITERCQGLPLAIVAIGRLLSLRKRTETEWRKVYEGLNWEEASDRMLDRVKNILSFSFNDLPYYLRSCFLYCSIFPEDYPIKRKRLIRLWVAEGFVEKGRGTRTMEEVAEDYLDELIHRCMLQVFKRNNFDRVKLCRMHDVVRELTLSISRRENFCMVYNNEEDDSIGEARRLSVQKGSRNLLSRRVTSHVRSFFMFDMTSSASLWKSVLSSFRLLRVLDLEGVPIETVPKEVVKLFNLHYLGLRKTRVRALPKSLGRLQNLETLDLYESSIERLPRGITKLKKLRHLFVESVRDPTYAELSSDPGVRAPKGIWSLQSLQTLQSVEADEEMVRNMGVLTELRTLRITKVRGIHCVELCSSLSKMIHLANLEIVASDEGEELRLRGVETVASLLRKLELRGQLEHGVLPNWFSSLASLQQLGLSWSRLREDPLPCLGSLPNLAVLGLYKAYDGEELCFQAGGFPKLKLLMLGGSARLDSVSIEEGAMPRLSELCLLRCGGMRLLPRGIEHLATLQVLHLLEMPEEFVERLRRRSGDNVNDDDRQRVGHIPTIKHVFQREGRWVAEILS